MVILFKHVQMKKIITVSSLLFSATVFSQNYINLSKEEVKKQLHSYINKNDLAKTSITETDTTLVIKEHSAASTYRFDKKGKCLSEKIIADSDASFKQNLQMVLDQKKYGWKKINGNQYISGFAEKLMIELALGQNDFTFIILRTDWSKEMYDILTAN